MDNVFYYFIDVDECTEGTSGCEQICSNTVGSFFCSCQSGYTLDADGTNCNGIKIAMEYDTSKGVFTFFER